MHISTGLSYALLGSATNTMACGFSLKPLGSHHINNNNIASIHFGTKLAKKTAYHVTENVDKFDSMHTIGRYRGGALKSSANSNIQSAPEKKKSMVDTLASFWAAGGVVMILAKSIKRILPIALEPFGSSAPSPLSQFQLG
jgi:hypothetical protein